MVHNGKPATGPGHRAVDWPALLRRQQRADAADAGGESPGPEENRAILKARAVQLAARPPQESAPGSRLECLEFQLSGESYAMDLSYISQTLPLADFTPLFCTPGYVLGITNLRGRIISIVDLRRFFELPEVGLCDLNRVIVVGDGTMEFGILADRVVGMMSLPLEDLQAPPAALTGLRSEFLTGVTADRLALLDIAKILSDSRILVHEEVG
jgi:purine-binding chemotaxis protein CheW